MGPHLSLLPRALRILSVTLSALKKDFKVKHYSDEVIVEVKLYCSSRFDIKIECQKMLQSCIPILENIFWHSFATNLNC